MPLAALAALAAAALTATIDSTWNNVAIGGGGYVTGLVQSTTAAYARTDVGGAWRLPFKGSTKGNGWTQMLASFPPTMRNIYAVESIAVECDVIYLAVGDGFRLPSAILRSDDGGVSWSDQTYVAPMAGNGNDRWCGERLAIDGLRGWPRAL